VMPAIQPSGLATSELATTTKPRAETPVAAVVPGGLPPPTAPKRVRPAAAWEADHLDEDGLPAMLGGDEPVEDEAPDSGSAARGVPHRSPQARRLVAGLLGLAALVAVAGGVRAMMARQDRQAEEERERAAAASASAAAPVTPTAATVTAPAPAPAAVAPGPAPTAAPSAIASAPAASSSAAAIEPGAPPAGGAPGEATTKTGTAADVASARTSTGGTHPASETALDIGPAVAGSSLVAQANRAMKKGDLQQAQDLARQAVAANPANADTWLTLGAAYQAAGNPSAAHEAYRSCAAQAHSANVSECRVLGAH
jgi:Flp pilus assembly protein TadD